MTAPVEFNDARWRRLAEADAVGEPLSAEDRRFLAIHQASSAELRAEQSLYVGLRRLGEEADDEASIAALVEAVVDRLPQSDQASLSSGSREARASWRWVGGLAAVAAVVVSAMVLDQRSGGDTRGDRGVAANAPPIERADALAVRAAAPAVGELSVERGVVRLPDGGTITEGAPPQGVVLTIGDEPACLRFGASRGCFDAGSRMSIGQDERALWVEAIDGRARLEVAPFDPEVGPEARVFAVEIAGARYTASEPTIVVVDLAVRSEDGTPSLQLERGALKRLDDASADDAPSAATGRQTGARTPRKSTRAASSASELLSQARKARAAGDRDDAIAAYRMLIEQHPGTPSARPALVSLGQLHLEAGQPRLALRMFDRYLTAKGPLAEEASYGRIGALRALGRRDAEQAAIRAFLATYPSSRYAATLATRIEPE